MAAFDAPRRGLALHWKIVIGLVLGVAVGVALDRLWSAATWRSLGVGDPAAFLARRTGDIFAAGKDSPANAEAGLAGHLVRWLINLNTLVGQLFFRALRFVAVPIVLCSLIVGVASLGDLRRLGRIGAKTLTLFMITTMIAIVIGLGLANAFKPGEHVPADKREALMATRQKDVESSAQKTEQIPTLWQQSLDLVPGNPFEALGTAMMAPGTIPRQGSLLQVIVLSIAIGAGLTMIPQSKAAPVIAFFDALTDVIVRLVHLIMLMAPYAVFALVVPAIATMGLDVLKALGVYAAVLTCGLAIALFAEYPLFLWFLAGMSPRTFFRGMAPAMLTAFSSSSSNATLPITMECTRERLGVSERITSFVCPLGATINMAGTAMYQGVAAAFIAQMYGLDLTLGQQAMIVLTATLAAVGTPGIPGAGVVMLVVVLESVHIRPEGIAVILGVDRLLDMCRTVVNISGDSATAVIVARSEGELSPVAVGGGGGTLSS
jgi:proton glutamate symport protein